MPVYHYKVQDIRARTASGTIAAESPRHARDDLRARGLAVEEIWPHQHNSGGIWRWLIRRRSSSAQLVSLLRELSTLLAVGVGIADALETLIRQHQGHFQTTLALLRDRVVGGARLAEAMRDEPYVFHELAIRMVEVGENTGNLEEVLDQLAGFLEDTNQLRDRVIGALLYPAIVFATALGVSLFLMTVVVPMLLSGLLEAGRKLPWPTVVLKSMSDVLLGYGHVLALVGLGLGVICVAVVQTSQGKRLWHRLLLRIPLVGSMSRRQTISRLAGTMATLMRSGIEYIPAAEIAARSANNLVFRQALLDANETIAAGQDIGTALAQTDVFPPLVIHVFSVGQASGRLEEMLDRLAADYSRQVKTLSDRLASVLEPVLILVLAVFVGFILFATLLPILEAGNVL
ncbi:MAG: type II secretion system F family protein [Pirellulaceae bacterium]